MGGEQSIPLPELPSIDYCCISTFFQDSLLLMYLGEAETEAVRNAIVSNWTKGIQAEEYKCAGKNKKSPSHFNCLKLKLHGRPFQTDFKGKEQSVQSRVTCAAIFTAMSNLGWKCVVSSDLSRINDFGAWFFQRRQSVQHPVFSIGLSSTDKLQINDCPDNIQSVIRQVCEERWVDGIQSEDKDGRTYEIKLNGNPWSWVSKTDSCSSRFMVKEIIQKLTANQYDLYCNSNLSGNADTLFFQYNQHLQGEVNFIVMSLNRSDRLRLINVPESICNQVKDTVSEVWPHGIQDTNIDENCFELKLKGTPWHAHGQESVHSRRLITKIMEKLASMGWFVMTGLDLTRKPTDKSVLLFRQGAPVATPFMCVYLNDTDKVRFIEAPQNVIEVGKAVIGQWAKGVQEEPTHYEGVTYQVKLKGNPWQAMAPGNGIYGRAMLLGLWCEFNKLGWRLVCSGDVSAKYRQRDEGPDYPLDVHSWWFMYDQALLAPM